MIMPTWRFWIEYSFILGILLLVVWQTTACSVFIKDVAPEDTIIDLPRSDHSDFSKEQMRVVFVTRDLAIGENRIAFAVLDTESQPVRLPEISAKFFYLKDNHAELRFISKAQFIEWDLGSSGIFVATGVDFDEVGRWGIVVDVPSPNGKQVSAQSGFKVKSITDSVSVGSLAPKSQHRTLHDVSNIAELTSSQTPDLDLYTVTIADSVEASVITVVSFASPFFCQTSVCGPQVDVLSQVKDNYIGRANFIHIEVYENPHTLMQGESDPKLSPLMDEWGLQMEPFTFIIDREGRVSAKFEGFVTMVELEDVIETLLDS